MRGPNSGRLRRFEGLRGDFQFRVGQRSECSTFATSHKEVSVGSDCQILDNRPAIAPDNRYQQDGTGTGFTKEINKGGRIHGLG